MPDAPSPVLVRAATTSDAAVLAQVHVESWRAAYRGLVPQPHLDALSWEDRRDRWQGLLAQSAADVTQNWVAVAAERVIGFASLGPSRDPDASAEVAELFAVYVRSDHWRGGTGSRLLQRGVAALPQHFRRVDVWVLEGNRAARDFYARCGFVADGAAKQIEIGGTWLAELRYGVSRPLLAQRLDEA